MISRDRVKIGAHDKQRTIGQHLEDPLTETETPGDPVDVGGLPVWEIGLPRSRWVNDENSANSVRAGESPDGLLSIHSLHVGNTLMVRTGPLESNVISLELGTGATLVPDASPVRIRRFHVRDGIQVPRYTMSYANGLLYSAVRIAGRRDG